jgi:hypothetical protein
VLVKKGHGVCGCGAAGVAEQSDHRQCLELRQDTASHDVISEYYATPYNKRMNNLEHECRDLLLTGSLIKI